MNVATKNMLEPRHQHDFTRKLRLGVCWTQRKEVS